MCARLSATVVGRDQRHGEYVAGLAARRGTDSRRGRVELDAHTVPDATGLVDLGR